MYGYTIFHENIINSILESIRGERASHAFIFEGAKGLYKHECARLIAAAFTCMNTKAAPCGTCHNCTLSKADTNPDIVYIKKPFDKNTINTESIRKLNEDVAVKPFNSPKKVYIISDGDLLNETAQNAFLKTLEEPPEYAVFIIIVENSAVLLPTIMSRAVLIKFPHVSTETTENFLNEKYPGEKDKIPFLVKFCEGVPGLAEKLIEDESFENLRDESLKMLPMLFSKDKTKAWTLEEFITSNKDSAEMIFDLWISYLRDVLIIKCSSDRIINSDKKKYLDYLVERIDIKNISNAIEVLLKGKEMIRRYIKIGAVMMYCFFKKL